MSYLEKKDRIIVKKGHQFVFVSINRYILGKFLMPFFFISKSFPVPLFDQTLSTEFSNEKFEPFEVFNNKFCLQFKSIELLLSILLILNFSSICSFEKKHNKNSFFKVSEQMPFNSITN